MTAPGELEFDENLMPKTEEEAKAMVDKLQSFRPSMAGPDDDEYNDFLARVEEVERTIKGMADGTVDVKALVAAGGCLSARRAAVRLPAGGAYGGTRRGRPKVRVG